MYVFFSGDDLLDSALEEFGYDGGVFGQRSPFYDEYRKVYNGACHDLFPRVILRPRTTDDVAAGIKAARRTRMKARVRNWAKGSIQYAKSHMILRSASEAEDTITYGKATFIQ